MVKDITLDVGAAGGTSLDAAMTVKHSIEHFLNLDDELSITIMGVATDSGGGGTLKSFLRALRKFFTDNSRVYIIHLAEFTSCSLHNIQTCFRNGILSVFGDSGTVTNDLGQHVAFKKNAM